MKLRGAWFENTDKRVTVWMARWGLFFLRISIGVIFLWFGALKFFEGLSPAQDLAIRTIDLISFGLLNEQFIIFTLAIWEVLIGVGLLFKLFLRETLLLLFLQMLGTFSPILFFPDEVFTQFPYALTLEGQYIVKNLIIVSAAITLGATVRGAKIVAESKM